jgi:hypothetical protein
VLPLVWIKRSEATCLESWSQPSRVVHHPFVEQSDRLDQVALAGSSNEVLAVGQIPQPWTHRAQGYAGGPCNFTIRCIEQAWSAEQQEDDAQCGRSAGRPQGPVLSYSIPAADALKAVVGGDQGAVVAVDGVSVEILVQAWDGSAADVASEVSTGLPDEVSNQSAVSVVGLALRVRLRRFRNHSHDVGRRPGAGTTRDGFSMDSLSAVGISECR